MPSMPATISDQLMISVYLKRDTHENGMTLQEYADAIIAGTQPVLSHDEFVYQFGAIKDEVILVADWATTNELSVVEANINTATVKLSGTVEQFNKLFSITLENIDGRITHQGTITIPSDIDAVVEFVLGLDNSSIYTHNAIQFEGELAESIPQGYPTKVAVTPPQVATAYNLPTGDGYGGCVGILELTYFGYVTGYNTADVNNSFTRIGLTPPTVVDVLVDGATRSTTSDAESMLDIYCAGGVVPRAKLVCYTAPNSNQGFYDCIMAVATDTTNRPSALGISWGGGESTAYLSSAFQACVAVGITCFSSTGDNGAAGYTCIYPSTDPYQIGAGGTSIYLNNNNTWNNEVAWSGGGGGVSSFVALPTWQTGLTSKQISLTGILYDPVVLPFRGVPDVSAPADPGTGYQFYVNSSLQQYGGTSAAAPFLAGMITRLTQLWGKRMTFANTLFYSNPSAFRDIVLGDNRDGGSGYTTTIGWDAATGLGTPNGAALYKLLKLSSTFPKLNYGFRPTTGQTYPRITTGAR
jgi:kumamolisin